MNKTHKAMIVSEDSSSVRVFSEFAACKLKCNSVGCQSPSEALRTFMDDIEIVVADLNLSGMSGLDFLSVVNEKYRAAVRILLVDKDDEIDPERAVNEAGLSYLFKKPLSFDLLQSGFEKIGFPLFAGGEMDEGRMLVRVIRAIFHDIKAPLTVIRADADMLTWDGIDGEKRNDLVESLLRQSDKISNLIDETGSIVKGRWRPDLKLSRMNSDGLMSVLISPFVRSAQKSGIRISCENKFAGYIMLDIDMMRRVLDNLLANSIEAGGREVAIRIGIGNDGDNLALEFIDNGPGIPGGRMESIFEPFVSMSGRKGLGLGLTICRGIVQRHGGGIESLNVSEGGAFFMIKLPLCRS